jgi:hypothetical protein
MNFRTICRVTILVLVFSAVASAQQRPLLTEDPRLIEEGSLVTETGFGYQHRARFPVSGLSGDLYQILTSGLHFGVGKRAEFQMTGTVFNYLKRSNGGGTRNDWGDLAVSTKIAIVEGDGTLPAISFRPTVVLPNSNRLKGIGTDSTNFFADILVGKRTRTAFIFGNIGLGILDDPLRPQSQHDVLTYGIATSVPAGSRLSVLAELNGYYNSQNNPSAGGESRGQARLGFQVKAGGFTWNAAATAGTTHADHQYGAVAGVSKEFKNLWR